MANKPFPFLSQLLWGQLLCLSETGPAYLVGEAGFVVPQGQYQSVINHLAQQLEIVYTTFSQHKPYQKLVDQAVSRYEEHLTWDIIANQLRAAYRDI